MSAASLLLLLSAGCVSAQTFTVDTSAPTVPLNMPLLDCVGSGHGALALREDYRAHLRAVQRDIGFAHIRGHGLLDDDMSTFLDGKANLINLFSVFDFYLSVGIKPIFELSFMPQALASDPSKTIMHYAGGTSPPKSPAAWATFIADIFTELIARYGADEVRSWKAEVWNEPNGCGFWCPASKEYQAEYFAFYYTTARAIATVDPFIAVGGPATAALAWVAEFINYTAAVSAPRSFVSTHSYPTDYRAPGALTRTAWEDGVIAAAGTAAAAGLPLVLTEMSAGLSSAYDAPFAAAFIVHAAAAFLGVANVPTLSFWTLSDIFEEPGFTSVAWAETFGMQTKFGVPKPSYRALQLLRQLPSAGLPVTAPGATPRRPGLGAAGACTATVGTVDVIAAVDAAPGESLRLVALVTNYNANIGNAENASDGLPIAPAPAVTVVFANLPASAAPAASATLRVLNSTAGWAKPVWLAAGSPRYPSAGEIADEMTASQPAVLSLPTRPGAGPHDVAVDLPLLEPYAVAFLTLDVQLSEG